MTKQILSIAFKYGLGLALLAYVIRINWAPEGGLGLAEALQRPIQIVPLALAGCLALGAMLLTFLRWYVLVRAQDLPFTIPDALRLGLIGYFLSTFLPGSIGGDIVKAAALAKEQSRRTVAVATVILDRAVGLWGMFWMVTLMGALFWVLGDPALEASASLQAIVYAAWGIVATTVVMWLLLGLIKPRKAERFARKLERGGRIGHSAAEFWRAISLYRRKGGAIAIGLALSLVAQLGFVLTFYFSAQVFQPPDQPDAIPSLAEHFLLVPVGMVVQAVFPAPGGVGGGEYGFGKLYELAGKPEANGVLGSLAQRAITWALSLTGYLLYLRMKPTLAQQPAEPPPVPEGATV